MQRRKAIAGTSVFLAAAPGLVAGLAPWLLTGWRTGGTYPAVVRIVGWVMIAVGAAVLIAAFAQFAVGGLGTPAPVAPTERLVVRGLYRYVRNPMYLAVLSVIIGQALVLSRPVLFTYAAVVAAAFAAFVLGYEQPTLARRYGAQYEAYRKTVPGWLPRLPRRSRRSRRPEQPH